MKQEERSTPAFDFLARIREGVPLEETVRERVQLSGNGARRTGLCPFHTEDSPSFTIWVDENRWHCFGCGRGGSVFDFVMQAEGVEFWEAAIRLAGRYGIPIPEFSKKDQQAAAREQAVRAFLAEYVTRSHELLWKKREALAYLAKRGITEESIREYQIGYGIAIKDPELRKKAVVAGLIKRVDGQEYELQMGRLIFPVVHQGKVLQITGRTLRDAKPKYISLANTGYTPIVPMGIHRLSGRECVLVEGAIDRILLEQAGIPACATVSANFSREWLRWLNKDARYILAYDADANQAGQVASEKIGRLLFEAGHAVEILELPEPHDPASYVQENGPEAFSSLIAQALPYISYWIRRQPAKPSSGDMQQILRQAYELIARVDWGIRGPFVREISEKYSVTQGDVRSGLAAWLAEHATSNAGQGALPGMPSRSDIPDDGRPVIYADDEDLPAVTEQVWEAVRLANQPHPQFFRQGGVPVRLRVDDNGAMAAQRWNVDIARYELTKIISWRRRTRSKTGEVEIEAIPPDNRWKNFLSVRDAPLPVLSRITEVPVFAPDGTLQTEPGYHPASRTYYVPAPGLELIELSESPTEEEAAKALAVFEDIVCDFPFVDQADKCHAFALWLLPFVRDMIAGPTPLHLIEAPTAGCGKGLLMAALVRPSVGPHIGSLVQANDDDEWRKRLTAIFMESRPVVMIDNLTRMLDSGVLASVLVEPTFQDRILGRTETVDVPIRCVWVCTANNPAMSTEIARRCIRIRIDPKMDRPWRREENFEFRHPDLRTFVYDHRADLIWAALTIVRAWVSKGMQPYSGRVLGSYEQWTRVIGGIAESVGMGGFLDNLLDLYEQADVEGQAWRAFVEVWWERHREREVSASDLFEIAKDQDFFTFGKVSEHSMKCSFGRRLAKQRDRTIGDYRVVQVRTKARALTWMLQFVGDPGASEITEVEPPTEKLELIDEEERFEWNEDGTA